MRTVTNNTCISRLNSQKVFKSRKALHLISSYFWIKQRRMIETKGAVSYMVPGQVIRIISCNNSPNALRSFSFCFKSTHSNLFK